MTAPSLAQIACDELGADVSARAPNLADELFHWMLARGRWPAPGLAAPTARAAPHVPLPCPRHRRSSPTLGYCVVGRAGPANLSTVPHVRSQRVAHPHRKHPSVVAPIVEASLRSTCVAPEWIFVTHSLRLGIRRDVSLDRDHPDPRQPELTPRLCQPVEIAYCGFIPSDRPVSVSDPSLAAMFPAPHPRT
jgi:hypothetical protein